MHVQCSKCSQPIELTDIIESNDGLLSHVDCKRPHNLTPEERALVFNYCSGHTVARCLACNVGFLYSELAADILVGSRTNMCLRCRRDLTEVIRAHLFRCAMVPQEVRLTVQAVREATQRLVKESRQLIDRSDIRLREAEAALHASRTTLRLTQARFAHQRICERAPQQSTRSAMNEEITFMMTDEVLIYAITVLAYYMRQERYQAGYRTLVTERSRRRTDPTPRIVKMPRKVFENLPEEVRTIMKSSR